MTQWQDTLPKTLQPQQILICRYPLIADTQSIAMGMSLLNKAEQDRAQKFKFERLREQFTIAHATLRQLLARYTLHEASEIEYTYNQAGKPALKHNPENLHFNLSHAGDWAVVAIALEQPIGVDIEAVSDRGNLDIAKRFFHPEEYQALAQLPGAEQQAAFFHIWVQKEAFVKATGAGIAYGLDKFKVSVTGEARIDQDYYIERFNVNDTLPGAIVCLSQPKEIRYATATSAVTSVTAAFNGTPS